MQLRRESDFVITLLAAVSSMKIVDGGDSLGSLIVAILLVSARALMVIEVLGIALLSNCLRNRFRLDGMSFAWRASARATAGGGTR